MTASNSSPDMLLLSSMAIGELDPEGSTEGANLL
jgi:hypothetical protein